MADSTPRRIRRMRTAGWRRGDAIIVDRSTRYGNPFRVVGQTVVAPDGSTDTPTLACTSPEGARKWAANLFDDWLNGTGPDVYRVNGRTFDRRRVLAALADGTLTGRDLACTCPLPEPGQPDCCHGQPLLRRANPGSVS